MTMPPSGVLPNLITAAPLRPLVAASILSADFAEMGKDCGEVLDAGADLLHLDVMDGHFVPNLTMGADMCRGLRKHFPRTYLDVHLMVERPGDYIDAFADAGASLLSFHAEVSVADKSEGDLGESGADKLIRRIHDAGMQAGMVINPGTGAEVLSPYLSMVDLVLVMSVNPGRSGQAFIPGVLDKAEWIKKRIGSETRLEIDGGMNRETAPLAVAAGVDVMVTASALFGSDNRAEVIRGMQAIPLPA